MLREYQASPPAPPVIRQVPPSRNAPRCGGATPRLPRRTQPPLARRFAVSKRTHGNHRPDASSAKIASSDAARPPRVAGHCCSCAPLQDTPPAQPTPAVRGRNIDKCRSEWDDRPHRRTSACRLRYRDLILGQPSTLRQRTTIPSATGDKSTRPTFSRLHRQIHTVRHGYRSSNGSSHQSPPTTSSGRPAAPRAAAKSATRRERSARRSAMGTSVIGARMELLRGAAPVVAGATPRSPTSGTVVTALGRDRVPVGAEALDAWPLDKRHCG